MTFTCRPRHGQPSKTDAQRRFQAVRLLMLALRKIRTDRGLSLNRLAAMTLIAATDLSLIEREARPAYAGWRRRIARALRVPQDILFVSLTDAEAIALATTPTKKRRAA